MTQVWKERGRHWPEMAPRVPHASHEAMEQPEEGFGLSFSCDILGMALEIQ